MRAGKMSQSYQKKNKKLNNRSKQAELWKLEAQTEFLCAARESIVSAAPWERGHPTLSLHSWSLHLWTWGSNYRMKPSFELLVVFPSWGLDKIAPRFSETQCFGRGDKFNPHFPAELPSGGWVVFLPRAESPGIWFGEMRWSPWPDVRTAGDGRCHPKPALPPASPLLSSLL